MTKISYVRSIVKAHDNLRVNEDMRDFLQEQENQLNKNFGIEARKIRQEKNISLRKKSKEIGISHVYLDDIENGRRHAPPDLRIRIIDAL